MRTLTGVFAVVVLLSLSSGALAGAVKVPLVPPDTSPEPEAKGFLKVKGGPGAELFEVKASRVTRGETYRFYLETAVDSGSPGSFAQFAEQKAKGVALKFKANSRRKGGPGMPGDLTPAQMAGRRLEIRDSEGLTILACVVPEIPGGDPAEVPALRILATDAPFPYANVVRAVVIVDRIELRKTGEPFSTLVEYPEGKELDLVKLQNGVVDVLFTGDPAPGDYDAMRVIVRAKEITVLDGGEEKTFTAFKVPSGEQTGVKLYFDPVVTVVTHLTTDLVLDFDLSRSFVVQGNPATPAGIKGFHFQPVLRVVNASTAGTLTFRVMSDNGTEGDTDDDFYVDGAAYEVIDDSGATPVVLASGATGTSPAGLHGWAFHPAIPAGTFTLEVSCTDHETFSGSVTIHVANLTDAGTIVLAASAGTISGTVGTSLTTLGGKDLPFILEGAVVTATLPGETDPAGTNTTNTFGEFELTGLPLQSFELVASKEGYSDGLATATPDVFGSPAPQEVLIELVPLTADVSGAVSDSAGGVVVATVRAVVLYAGVEEVIAEATSGTGGSYNFVGLPTGSFTIRASITVGDKTMSGSADLVHVGGGDPSSGVDVTVAEEAP